MIQGVRDRRCVLSTRCGQQHKASCLGLVIALLAAGALADASPAMASFSPLKWAPPLHADASPPFASPTAVNGISCPSTGLCVGVDGASDVLTSTAPTGGPGAWSHTVLESREGLGTVACASSTLCVASASDGNIFSSTDPTGGPGAWLKAKVDPEPERQITSISCPSTQLCVAGDNRGNVAVSTDPAGPAGTWSLTHIDGTHNHSIDGVSCPSVRLCVAVSSEGEVITSIDPTGGNGAWTISKISEGTIQLADVACPTESLCIATDNLGEILTSTDPTSSGTWSATKVEGSGEGRISCPTADFCAVTGSGAVFTSTDPTNGAAAWSKTLLNLSGTSIDGVACPSSSLCVLADSASGVVTSTEPTGGESAWTVTELEVGINFLSSIACASLQLCVAVDNAGNAVSSTDPVGWRHPWNSAHVDEHPINSISCPTDQFCAAVDNAGNALTSSDPAGGASAWSAANIDGMISLEAVSCPSENLCVATDQQGNIVSSNDPRGGTSAWHVAGVAEAGSLKGISCPSNNLCVALDESEPLVSIEPTGGEGAWLTTNFYIGHSISCPSIQLCVALRFPERKIVVSTEPTEGIGAWGTISAEKINGLDEVGCAAEWLCVISTYSYSSPGEVLISANPTGGLGAWSQDNVYGLPLIPPDEHIVSLYHLSLTGISCVSEKMCVVVDPQGNAMVGTPAVAPANLEAPTIAGVVGVGQSLSCTSGSWSGEPAPELSYQWLQDGAAINAATASAYTVQSGDSGQAITCEVTAINGGGTSSATSASVQVPEKPVNAKAPSLSGTPEVGQSLTCSQGIWENDPTSYAYAWRRGGAPVAGQSESSYTVQSADAGHGISCEVTVTNGGGSATAMSETLQVSSTVPPAISNDFKILAARSRKNGRIVLVLAAPGSGSFRATATTGKVAPRPLSGTKGGPKRSMGSPCGIARPSKDHRFIVYGTGSAPASATGTTRLTIKPRHAQLGALRSSGWLCVRIAVSYLPHGGSPRTEQKSVAVSPHKR